MECGVNSLQFAAMEMHERVKHFRVFAHLLTPIPKSPSVEIDVYLQSLIEKLKNLWTFGVRKYDCLTSHCFQLYVALLWTINDFPTYDDLFGWCTKGYHIWVGTLLNIERKLRIPRCPFGSTRFKNKRRFTFYRSG